MLYADRTTLAQAGRSGLAALVLVLVSGGPAFGSAATPAVNLGTAGSYATLAGSTVTNTGPSTLNGDLGLSPGTSITGFPPGKVNGVTHATDAAAAQAQSDLKVAYDDAAGRSPVTSLPADAGGLTVTDGVYGTPGALGLTGTLTLDGQGDASSVFIFKVGSALTTATSSRVRLINGAQACNVFWQVGSSATLGTSSTFVGSLLTLSSISLNDSVTVTGRTLARNGAVTLINDTINLANCAAGSETTTGTAPTTGTGPGTDQTSETGTSPTAGSGPTSGPAPDGSGPAGDGTGANPGTGPGPSTLAASAAFTRIPAAPVTGRCVKGTFRVVVRGRAIRRVVFTVGGRVVTSRGRAPFRALINAVPGIRRVVARVTFTDGTRARTLRMSYRSCARAAQRGPSRRPRTPSGFTG